MKTEDSNKLISELYTANNRDGQTWLVADNPYPDYLVFSYVNYGKLGNPEWAQFRRDHPDILLTDYIPGGTKVRRDEIDVKWQFNLHGKINKGQWFDCLLNDPEKYKGENTRQIATLKQKREVVEDAKLYTEAEVKQIAIKFFYYWWNAKGNNTESGFDEWFGKQKLDK